MDALKVLRERGVSRLCHFTKLQSLTHILSSESGILASKSIRSDIKNVTDKARYDGELDYICCSIEYPNSWFLEKAISDSANHVFKEWVVLYIDIEILKYKDAKYCPCNASKNHGKYINNRIENIDSVFAEQLVTFRYPRTPNMLACCPTDGQAEILIRDCIPRSYVTGIVVGNEDIAKNVYAMLEIFELRNIEIFISPDVLTSKWSNIVKQGKRPYEKLYEATKEECQCLQH